MVATANAATPAPRASMAGARGVLTVGTVRGSNQTQQQTQQSTSTTLTTGKCATEYMRCLRRDSACGSTFENCTTSEEFNAVKVYCADVYNSCDAAGKKALESLVNKSIADAIVLTAENAVDACYKTMDECMISTCSVNLGKCTESTGNSTTNVKAYVKQSCLETVGRAKACRMMANAQANASDEVITDEASFVFDDVYNDRYEILKGKLAVLVAENIVKQQGLCYNEVRECVQNNCAGGSLAACYTQSKVSGRVDLKAAANVNTQIENGCTEVINSSLACQDAYTVAAGGQASRLFTHLWTNDAAGFVVKLNGELSASFSDGMITQMRESCQASVEKCIKTECGADYGRCYDITAKELDAEVVASLCMATVKNDADCKDTFFAEGSTSSTWGGKSNVRAAWNSVKSSGNDGATVFQELLEDTSALIKNKMKADAMALRSKCKAADITNNGSYTWASRSNASNVATDDLDNTCWVTVELSSKTNPKLKNLSSAKMRMSDQTICGGWHSESDLKKDIRTGDKAARNKRGWVSTGVGLLSAGAGVGLMEVWGNNAIANIGNKQSKSNDYTQADAKIRAEKTKLDSCLSTNSNDSSKCSEQQKAWESAVDDRADLAENKGLNKTGRLISDAVGGAALGTTGFLVTRQIMLNNAYDSEIADISCFIAGQEVASYGDPIGFE